MNTSTFNELAQALYQNTLDENKKKEIIEKRKREIHNFSAWANSSYDLQKSIARDLHYIVVCLGAYDD